MAHHGMCPTALAAAEMVIRSGKEAMGHGKIANPRESHRNAAAVVPEMVEMDGRLEPWEGRSDESHR